jgi:hypothetical protein
MKNLYFIRNVTELAAYSKEIVATVNEEGYATIRGMFDPKEIRTRLKLVIDDVSASEIRASSGVGSDEIKDNLVKWSIGGQSVVQSGLPRFMVSVYNTFFSEDKYGLHSNFETLIQVRDTLANRLPMLDDKLLPARYNGCRLQIYPAGGGFMGAHVDSRAMDTNNGKNDYIQLVMLLTQKGKDYQSGGAYVVHRDRFIDVEADTLSGDVIVYNGDTIHGVADIDPQITFDRVRLKGRVVSLVTIYTNNLNAIGANDAEPRQR